VIPVAIGVVVGAVLAHHLHAQILISFFAIFLFIVSVRMFRDKRNRDKHNLPGILGMSSAGIGMGLLSGLLGVGGGTTVIPFLNYCNIHMRKAVMVSFCMGITIAFVGAAAFAIAGLHNPLLPKHVIGYIYWPAWFTISIGSVLMSPVGAYYSHRLPSKVLRKVFAVFLLMVSIHMSWGLLHASISSF
ncbi:MAG: sulfite exporter TauE/SafE family protein, partial [Gammaproteobacteria bacterium]|nr:sulfite exporter TauE/SafE family protein [Gammaproteobacteria bacterium]